MVPTMKRWSLLVFAFWAGCGGGSGGDPTDGGPTVDGSTTTVDSSTTGPDSSTPEDFDMKPTDFECMLRWPKVRNFRLTNKLGHTTDAVAIATANTGGDYPVGTLIQLVPFEAMIKRRAGFNPASRDWEFFSLSVSSSGTTIRDRGTSAVVNQFGGNCFTCHNKALPQWDFICETAHGCDPLPINATQIMNFQNADARCP
jgi:hypothetical protein